jgi:hypothetical protein
MNSKTVLIPGISTEESPHRTVSRPMFDFAPNKCKEFSAYMRWLMNVKQLSAFEACDVAMSAFMAGDIAYCVIPPTIEHNKIPTNTNIDHLPPNP